VGKKHEGGAVQSLVMQIREFFDRKKPQITVDKIPFTVIRKLLIIMDRVPDVRQEGKVQYALKDLLLLAFLAMLGGADGYTEIAAFWESQKKFYKKLMREVPIASHDTFRRVLSLIDGTVLNKLLVDMFVDSIEQMAKALGVAKNQLRVVVIDGKELRGSGRLANTDKQIKNAQILNVYDQSREVCLYSILIDEKHNEIPHAQEVLETMDLTDTVVLADALHGQKKTTAIVTKQKGDFLIGLKENQPQVYEIAQQLFDQNTRSKMEKQQTAGFYTTVEKAHNQVEVRTYYLKKVPTVLKQDLGEWEGLKAFVCVETICTHTVTEKVTSDTRYFISSITDVKLAAELIRGEWSVENRLHWLLDTVMAEDDDLTVDRNAARNLSMMRKMCLSLYKLLNSTMNYGSVRGTRKRFGWNFDESLALVLTMLDAKTLRKALELD